MNFISLLMNVARPDDPVIVQFLGQHLTQVLESPHLLRGEHSNLELLALVVEQLSEVFLSHSDGHDRLLWKH